MHTRQAPPHLPHLEHDGILFMGLTRIAPDAWIEADRDFPRYLQHKHQQRTLRGDGVYRSHPDSLPAQQELAAMLRAHLLSEHADDYHEVGGQLHYAPTGQALATVGAEPLWDASLWIGDDVLLMQERKGVYHLTAASLCSPSSWSLAEKFNQPIRTIHDPIPGFHPALSDKIDRVFGFLQAEHPVIRYNWSLQADDTLAWYPDRQRPPVAADTALYYRCERQSLRRLPETGALAFTVKVYVHPLASLANVPGALPRLLAQVATTPPELAAYKGFPRYQAALEKYSRHQH